MTIYSKLLHVLHAASHLTLSIRSIFRLHVEKGNYISRDFQHMGNSLSSEYSALIKYGTDLGFISVLQLLEILLPCLKLWNVCWWNLDYGKIWGLNALPDSSGWDPKNTKILLNCVKIRKVTDVERNYESHLISGI